MRANNVFSVEKTVAKASINLSATIDQANIFSFTLSDLPQVSAWTAVFDVYRIMQVEVDFLPVLPSTQGTPPLYTVIDYDDNNALTSLGATLEYDTIMITQMGQMCRRILKPRVSVALYGGAFTQFGQVQNQWIDAASPGTIHYGVKTYFPSYTGATTGVAYNVVARYLIQFKNTR
jgi:hypothetical protein